MGLLVVSVSYIKSIPTHEKSLAAGKKSGGPKMPLLTYFFLWLGWPWVGDIVGYTVIFICSPTPTEPGRSRTHLAEE